MIDETRLQQGYEEAAAAGRRYAALNEADAMQRIREVYPTAQTVRFDLCETEDAGWDCTLIAIRDGSGHLLWHFDTMEAGDIGDDSTISDRLATAESWGRDYFCRAAALEPCLGYSPWGDLFEVTIDDERTDRLEARQ